MGNYVTSPNRRNPAPPPASPSFGPATVSSRSRKRTKSEADSDDDDCDQCKVLDELLLTPKRKKLKSTSVYIYETLFENGENSDITISALGREWKLHKVYLCQSGYFNSMFKGSWKESNLNYIDIIIPDENIDKEALDTAFGSLYSDDVVMAPTTVIPVLATATLLSLEDLIVQCAYLMMETMSAKSVCCYHIASLMYGQREVTEACLDWLQKNIMHCQALSLLKEISVSLMTEVIGSSRLFVMQVEMDVYTMLRKWLFLKLQPEWEGTMKEVARESDLYFKAKYQESDIQYLDSLDGEQYLPVFENLRLQHVVNDVSSVKIVEDDGIIPSSWLEPIYRQRWLQMLRVDQLHRSGMMRVDTAEFQKKAMRCGRVLDKDGQYCWRWTGYNFGVDLLVSFNSRLIFFKRNTLTQSCPGAVSLHEDREIVFELRVATFNVHGQTTFEKSSGIKSFSLLKDEEAVIMTIDRHAKFPLHISCHFLTYATLVHDSNRASSNS